MSRTIPFLIALSVTLLGGCASSDFASQCDGLSDLDEQTACLDDGFQMLRVQQADCLGDDRDARADECFDGCRADRGLSDEECRLACYDRDDRGDDDRGDDDRGDDDRGDDDRGDDDRGDDDRGDDDRGDDDRGDDDRDDPGDRGEDGRHDRGELDDLHLRTRDNIQRVDRSRERGDMIREGLRDGEDFVRCDRV